MNLQQRTKAIEWMDDFEISGEELHKTLRQIAGINKWLGGNSITKSGVIDCLQQNPKTQEFHILDLGCGNGDMLRTLAIWARKNDKAMTFCGVDANPAAVQHAKALSTSFPEIRYVHSDVFELSPELRHCDITLCTLFLHHFSMQDIEQLLSEQLNYTRIGVVVNDLHRHWLAYRLFYGLCLFVRNNRIKEDGLISIRRGFKRRELLALTNQLNAPSKLRWKWAYRYQWIIKK